LYSLVSFFGKNTYSKKAPILSWCFFVFVSDIIILEEDKDMMMLDSQHCSICSLTVAPNDPERQTVGRNVVHGNCLKRHLAHIKQADIKQEQVTQKVQVH